MEQKKYLKTKWPEFSKFCDTHQLTDPRRSMDPKRVNTNNTTKQVMVRPQKQRWEKNFKSAIEKRDIKFEGITIRFIANISTM